MTTRTTPFCTPAAAALALVSARPTTSNSSTTTSAPSTTASAPSSSTSTNPTAPAEEDTDPDLRRARDLVQLHRSVRLKCQSGELAREIKEVRRDIEKALS